MTNFKLLQHSSNRGQDEVPRPQQRRRHYRLDQNPPRAGIGFSKTLGRGAGRRRQKEEIPKLSREYLAARNRQMRAKALTAEMEGVARRGELISLKLVRLQMLYLLTVMRQHILALPSAYGPRLVGMEDAHSAGEVLREAALALLEDLQNIQERVVDPNWLESLGENEKL